MHLLRNLRQSEADAHGIGGVIHTLVEWRESLARHQEPAFAWRRGHGEIEPAPPVGLDRIALRPARKLHPGPWHRKTLGIDHGAREAGRERQDVGPEGNGHGGTSRGTLRRTVYRKQLGRVPGLNPDAGAAAHICWIAAFSDADIELPL